MAMRRRGTQRQTELWIPTQEMAASPGHPFYERLNALLAQAGFDRFAEDLCEKFYADGVGRPGIPPGVYFRMLLIGYFEGLDSEREIAWRCADSLGLRSFLGYKLTERTPDHSSLTRIRQRIDLETHDAVFAWVLKLLADKGLLKGKTLGVDATTLEANAALKSIVRRDTGQGYEDFLGDLAKAEGIQEPTRSGLAKLDRKRPKKGSNAEWVNPNAPDAKIAKMKDGRTHMAHKAEHAVDLDTGAIMAVTIQEANAGDTKTIRRTMAQANENLRAVAAEPQAGRGSREVAEETRSEGESSTAAAAGQDRDVACEECEGADETAQASFKELVTDKGYHSNETTREYSEAGVRTYMSEPARKGRRRWKGKEAERAAVYGNRRRIKGKRGKALLRKRGELLERPFAHCYDTGGMRRVHLRGHGNILKRVLVHVAGFNLGLVMRALFGVGKPRGLRDVPAQALSSLLRALLECSERIAVAILHCLWIAGRVDGNSTHIVRTDRRYLAAA